MPAYTSKFTEMLDDSENISKYPFITADPTLLSHRCIHTQAEPQMKRFDSTPLSYAQCVCCKFKFCKKWQPTEVYACNVEGCTKWICAVCFLNNKKLHRCFPEEDKEVRWVIFDLDKEDRCTNCDTLLSKEKPAPVKKCGTCGLWICKGCWPVEGKNKKK
ncbi:hypothetical protein BJ508DRAFT_331221 [Ascobolus immersus RN42]|uniref:Uncharacterized protein n=1 Tax=Ascobolus immersus RN42 TaxID=1160509 RepID=A0A3N4HTL0_ASCIM|nr:hypothetical protein BJ508DRAFT_331221 [Ascobolus immersus RN42]